MLKLTKAKRTSSSSSPTRVATKGEEEIYLFDFTSINGSSVYEDIG